MKSYQIYIPKYYNAGTPIPKEKIAKILNVVIEKFGFASFVDEAKMPLVQGTWTSKEGKRYSDKVSLLYLILEDRVDHNKWFTSQAEIWRQDLGQKELIIVVQYAELIVASE